MKNTRKRKTKKGDFGYFSSEKKRRLLITAGLFSLPLLVFFVAWAVNGTRMTVWTVLTVVGCILMLWLYVEIRLWDIPVIQRWIYRILQNSLRRLSAKTVIK